ncbi:MAG: helix-turn-helix transcriptional regulator [Daejeonella sp.]|uniref:helix-turn-helix domain-containing protein n=1 Tax=Daejeonella sp. TaxID=2805397 RepID=UPI002733F15B|nr:helix-turn-helix transcriptional regulator [Daejeonella sp.]MDP3468291.1 helix-turn-helix transcriptional regulator [Daejeonella sp.]
MNPKKLEEKLYQRRKFLGLDQEYMGAKMNMTQSGYSWIENGKVKFSDELLNKIKAIDGFADFDAETPEPKVKAGRWELIQQIWPWNILSLYFLLFIIVVLLLEQAYRIAIVSYEGIYAGFGPDHTVDIPLLLIFLLPFALLTWYYWPKKADNQ